MNMTRQTAFRLRLAIFMLLLSGLLVTMLHPAPETIYEARINKQLIGYGTSPSEMNAMLDKVEEELKGTYFKTDLSPYYSVEYEKVARDSRAPSSYEAVREATLALQKYTTEGFELIIDGKVYARSIIEGNLEFVIDQVRARLTKEFEDIKNVEFRETVEILPGKMFLRETLTKLETDTLATHLLTGREHVETYVIQSGDTLSSIAAAHGLSLEALAEANPDVDMNKIYPGEELFLSKPSPILHRK